MTSSAELEEFDRAASTEVPLDRPVAEVAAVARDVNRWPEWFPMHAGWSAEPPAELAAGTSFGQRIKVMGIPAEIQWTVARSHDTSVRLDGSGRVGVTMSVFLDVLPDADGSRIRLALGIGGDAARGPMGASVQRAAQEAIDAAGRALAAVVAGTGTRTPAGGPIRHERTGVELDPRTPVIVGAGQLVQRDPKAPFRDPVAMSVAALRTAAEDAGAGIDLLAGADAVYAVASASWMYRDQAALVAEALGATPAETVVSARFGGDGAQLMINAAAAAIAAGTAEIVLVSGAEAGASLAAAQKAGDTPEWPQQPDDVSPTRVIGSDREANNDAEAAAQLGVPIYMYALLESAVRAAAGRDPAKHQSVINELWSRFSEVAAENPFAWRPTAFSADELSTGSDDNRPISSPYLKLHCANLTVDLATGLILCSAAAAQAAGVPQDRWVFVHAGAAGHDEWYVSERADLAASPAIRAIGAAALAHAGIGIDDVAHVDLYSCFPAAVQIAAAELGLPIDDPKRPLTVTGGLTFAGGPGNNYGAHAVATLVGRLRADPDGYGLSTSLGWFITKHALGIYSARPPARPYADLHPAIDHPPARRALSGYAGPAVLEAVTLPYDRAGTAVAAVVSSITPDGARVLLRTTRPDVIAALADADPLRREVAFDGADGLTLGGPERLPLPAPPPAPVLVERRGPILVITLNRPQVRNAVDRRTALLLERIIDGFEADDGLRVAVLTGGETAFCSGMDLKAAARGEYPFTEHRGLLGFTGTPPSKPMVAAVEGPALAGGCELALSCDLIVASTQSQFGIPEAKRGLVAAAGGVLRLAQRLPRAIALELALTADPIGAERALELGLINRVVEPGRALDAAVELAERVAANAPLSVSISKRIVDESPDWPTAEGYRRQSELAGPVLGSADAAEGIRAFAEHRDPVWTGR